MSNEKMKRQPGVVWFPPNTWDHVPLQVLMDIRDELQRMNAVLHCPNFTAIPSKLDAIRRKIPARKKKQ